MQLRLVLIVAGALLLSACSNMVTADRPLLQAEPTAPVAFRPGLWASWDKNCRFDRRQPPARWPKCAEPIAIDEHGSVVDDPTVMNWRAGRPMVLEFAEVGKEEAPVYFYAGFEVIDTDRDGRASALRFWPVQCGPPSPPDRRDRAIVKSTATKKPLPGLTMHEGNCLAQSADAVHLAAAHSRAWAEAPVIYRWVRERP